MTNATSLWNDPELATLRNELFGEEIPVDITFDGFLPSPSAPAAPAPVAPVAPRYDSLAPMALAAGMDFRGQFT